MSPVRHSAIRNPQSAIVWLFSFLFSLPAFAGPLLVSPALAQSPVIDYVYPTQISNCTPLAECEVYGAHFVEGATVTLTQVGQADIMGLNMRVHSSGGLLWFDVPVADAPLGLWDVVVANPDTQSDTLPAGLEIADCVPPVITTVSPQRAIYPPPGGGELAIYVHGTDLWVLGEFPATTAVVLRRDGFPDLTTEEAGSSGSAANGILSRRPDSDWPQAAPGLYDLVLTRADGGTTTVPDAIEILADPGRRVELVGAWGGSVEAIHVDGAANLAYVGTGQTMHILDVSGMGDPIELGSLWFPGVAVYGIDVRNGLAYVGGADSAAQSSGNIGWFGVVDVSDPAAPLLLSSLNTTFNNGKHQTVRLSDDGLTVYTGATSWRTNAFDVSDPANPIYLGTVSGAGGIHTVRGAYLYWAKAESVALLVGVCELSPPDTCSNNNYIEIPTAFHQLGTDVGVALSGDYLYVTARFSASEITNHCEIFVIDISDPAAPLHVGTWNAGGTIDVFEFDSSVAISDGRLYWAGSWIAAPDTTRRTMVIFDIATDPTAPVLIGEYVSDASFQEIEVVGTTAYLGDRREGFTVVDCADPANPVRVGNYYSPSQFMRAARNGDTLYVTDWHYGVTALDISDPNAPTLLGKWETGPGWDVPGQIIDNMTWSSANFGIDNVGDLVYVAAGWNGLQVVDFANPANPVLAGAFPFAPCVRATALELAGIIAQVGIGFCTGGGCLVNFDVSDPQNILDVGFVCPGIPPLNFSTTADGILFAAPIIGLDVIDNADLTNPFLITLLGARDADVVVDGDLLYVADGWVHDFSGPVTTSLSSLRVLDMTDPFGPTVDVGLFETNTYSQFSLDIAGDLAFLAGDGGGPVLRMLDVSDPASPFLLDTAPTAFTRFEELLADPPYLYALSQPESTYTETSSGVLVYRFYTLGDDACPADLDGDGAVSASDLAQLLGAWGPCDGVCPADLDADGDIDAADLAQLLGSWGDCP